MYINQILSQNSAKFNDKIAIIEGEEKISYSLFMTKIQQLTRGLVNLGLVKGDYIAVYLGNGKECLYLYFAAFSLGITVVPINSNLKHDTVTYIINHTKSKYLFSDARFSKELNLSLKETPTIKDTFVINYKDKNLSFKNFNELYIENDISIYTVDINENDPALILYTSGSTGLPKGIVMPYKSLNFIAKNYHHFFNFDANEITLISLSMMHGGSISIQLIPSIANGSTMLLVSDTEFDNDIVLDIIANSAVTSLVLVPSMCYQLAAKVKSRKNYQHQLKQCYAGGDAVSVAVQHAFQESFGLAVKNCYGMSEFFAVTINENIDPTKQGSIGLPVENVSAKIIDEKGQTLAPNQSGELCIKSPAMMIYYLNNPEATEKTLIDGWCLTGDLASIDEEGYIWYEGRKKMLIIYDGYNISPIAVESAFYRHPDVLEVGVTGVKDDEYGELIHAFVTPKSDAVDFSVEKIHDFVAQILPEYEVPHAIHIIDVMPKTGIGKVDRKSLIDLLPN